jgi:tRNA 2-thiouridine synthesizing protein A
MRNLHVCDVRGRGCGDTLIELAALARQLGPDNHVLVWTDDRGAPSELPAWCRMTGHRYRGVIDTSEAVPRYLIVFHPTTQPGVRSYD